MLCSSARRENRTMHNRLVAITIGAFAAASMTMQAQTPQNPPTPQSPDNPRPTITDTQTRATPANPTITISGCLKEEKDVPALKPSAVERAGVTDDYVLTDVKISPGSSVSGIGVSSKYEIEGIAEAEL